jgi:hypothetical protein
VTSRSPAQMPLVPGDEDQAARLERFRAAHPEVPVLLLGTCPRAWVGDQKIKRPTLRGLLDGPANRGPAWVDGHALVLPSSSIAAVPQAAAAVSRLAERPCGLALTRRTRPRQSSSEEDGSTSLEDRRCEIGVLADQAMPLIPGS